MSPDSRRGPGAGAPSDDRPAKRIRYQRSTRYTPPPPDPEYDELVDLEGYETDPLTADHWAALVLAAERGDLTGVVE